MAIPLDFKAIKRFKTMLHGSGKVWWQCFSKDPDRAAHSSLFNGAWNLETRLKLKEANKNKMEISMAVNECDGGRKAENVTKINFLFVDSDEGNCSIGHLLVLPVEPSMVIASSPGNIHAYWPIIGCSVEDFKELQVALAKMLGTDQNVCDPGRVMRVPGTVNYKREEPYLTKFIDYDEEAEPTHVDTFIEKMGLSVKRSSVPVSNAEVAKTAKPAGDFFNEAVRIEEALKGISADERDVWRRMGMAIHSFDPSKKGYRLWTEWSRTSKKFDQKQQEKEWSQFREQGGVNIESLYWYCDQLKQLGGVAYNDFNLCELLVAEIQGKLCFDAENRAWLEFNGVVWKIDSQAPLRHTKFFIESLGAGALGKGNKSLQKYLSVFGMQSLVKMAELSEELRVNSSQFDRRAELLAVKNGVLNLNTGEFHKAEAEDWLRRQANVMYDPDAVAKTWIKFMKSVTCGDLELMKFLRRAFGYTAFGHANLQLFFMMIGSGGNGKGVLSRIMQKLFGEYAQSVAPNLMTTAFSGNANGPTPALARLDGARMLSCPELPTTGKLDTAFIKAYAGGDEIIARPTYGEMHSFKPEGKLWVSTNEVPDIAATDHAMWRRLVAIPFNGIFQGDNADENLEKSLADELPGILNWLLKGTKEFAEAGIGTCKAVEAMKLAMRNDADSVGSWLAENCMQNEDASVQSSIAYENYASFMRRSRRGALTQPLFKSCLIAKGIRWRKRNNGNFFFGIAIRT